MKKENATQLTLGKTTIAMLNTTWSKRPGGLKQWHGMGQSTLPACDVTNPPTGTLAF